MNKFDDIMSKLDRASLNTSIDSLKDVLNSPEGNQIRAKIKNLDKKTLLDKLNSIDTRKIPNSNNIKNVAQDPSFLSKLNSFLDNQ